METDNDEKQEKQAELEAESDAEILAKNENEGVEFYYSLQLVC